MVEEIEIEAWVKNSKPASYSKVKKSKPKENNYSNDGQKTKTGRSNSDKSNVRNDSITASSSRQETSADPEGQIQRKKPDVHSSPSAGENAEPTRKRAFCHYFNNFGGCDVEG